MSNTQATSYYKQINHVKYDRSALETADRLQQGQGDGRISIADAQQLSAEIYDGPGRTKTEDKTVRRIYENENFTQAGRDAFEHANRSAGAKQGWKTRRENAARNAAQTINPMQSINTQQTSINNVVTNASTALQAGALASPNQTSAGVAILQAEQN